MKKWCKFFWLGFFSNKISKEGVKRGYTSFFLALCLALVFLWVSFIGGDMLPFGAHYHNAPGFNQTARSALANSNLDKRVTLKIENHVLKAKKQGGEYTQSLLVNTFENDEDRQNYSVNDYNIVVDTRPANTLAEVRAYCLSNDGENNEISYEEYLTLSQVAKLNFDFKLSYTGNALILNDGLVASYREYVDGLSEQNKAFTKGLENDLNQNKITKDEYDRAIYQAYFTNYYPKITDYESSSQVPLLRNYYYHEYINKGFDKYLFIFDDYMAGSFQTQTGIGVTFYGFYSDLDDGVIVGEGFKENKSNELVDNFIIDSFKSVAFLNLYAYAMNVLTLAPFIALMPMVVTLLAHSILKLRGVESIKTFGATFRIIGCYVWFSGLISAVVTVIMAFFVQRSALNALPLVAFFITLAIRSIAFVIGETKLYMKQLLEQEKKQQVEE